MKELLAALWLFHDQTVIIHSTRWSMQGKLSRTCNDLEDFWTIRGGRVCSTKFIASEVASILISETGAVINLKEL